ncbi:MAG TPA: hypothetical protein VIZ64_05095, partial [Dokdonella sp.]
MHLHLGCEDLRFFRDARVVRVIARGGRPGIDRASRRAFRGSSLQMLSQRPLHALGQPPRQRTQPSDKAIGEWTHRPAATRRGAWPERPIVPDTTFASIAAA